MMKRTVRRILMIAVACGLAFSTAQADLRIPEGIKTIAAETFMNVPLADAEVILPDNIIRIESRAFAATGIRDIRLPESIEYIAPDAFDGCEDFHPAVRQNSYAAEWCAVNGITPYVISGLGTENHTPAEIRAFISNNPAEFDTVTQYRKNPRGGEYGGSTYDYGLIANDSLTNGINMVNIVRYIAGLNANVVNAEEMEPALGASALVNALNGGISHFPPRPDVLGDSKYDELYELACTGGGSSNLYSGPQNLASSVLGYMHDSDPVNIDRVGHRRWLLNPSMGKTTFGFCHATVSMEYGGQTYTFQTYYSGLYAFDRSGSGQQAPVAWPARNMPVSYFAANQAWSVSFGKQLQADAIRVKLTRKRDGAVWRFSTDEAATDGYFNVENSGYGLPGCVIFRPSDLGEIRNGDEYTVQIRNNGDFSLTEYTVSFFGL